MTLFRLRWKLLLRWLRVVGWFLPVVLLFVAGCGAALYLLAEHLPLAVLLGGVLVVVRIQLLRRDHRLLYHLLAHPTLQLAAEYLLLALLPGTLLAFHGWWYHALGVVAAAPLCAFVPPVARTHLMWLRMRIAWLGYSPEWCAGVRRHPLAIGLLVLGCAACALMPYAGFVALALAALCCAELYADNEPLALLLLAERSSSRLLADKIGSACRNYFIATLPVALLAALLHPAEAWLAAVWVPYAALVLTYSVLAKYARYDPAVARPTLPGGALIGYLGFLVPLLLPVTLALLVVHAVRAERNLNRYLYDYD